MCHDIYGVTHHELPVARRDWVHSCKFYDQLSCSLLSAVYEVQFLHVSKQIPSCSFLAMLNNGKITGCDPLLPNCHD